MASRSYYVPPHGHGGELEVPAERPDPGIHIHYFV
jgi:hypothetical protein